MGITLCAAAMDIGMLIIGRIAIGLGVGLGNQVGDPTMALGSISPSRFLCKRDIVLHLRYMF